MENPIKMDDLGVPLFLETPGVNLKQTAWICCFQNFRWVFPNGGCTGATKLAEFTGRSPVKMATSIRLIDLPSGKQT